MTPLGDRRGALVARAMSGVRRALRRGRRVLPDLRRRPGAPASTVRRGEHGHRQRRGHRGRRRDEALRAPRGAARRELRGAGRARWSPSSAPTGRARRRCCRSWPGCSRRPAARVSRTAREVGWVPQQPAVYAKLSVAENLRLFARLERVADPDAVVARMLEQTGLGRARRRRAGDAVGRQPPAGQHRRRAAGRPARAGARRAVVVAGPAPARAAVGVHRAAGGARERRSSSPRTTSARPSATPTACSCWPTARSSSPARRPTSRRSSAATRGTSRRPSCASCTSAGTSWPDALAAAQGPADPAPLALPRGDARRLPGDHRGPHRPGPVARPGQAEGRDRQRAARRGRRASRSAASSLDVTQFAKELFKSVQPVAVATRAQAIDEGALGRGPRRAHRPARRHPQAAGRDQPRRDDAAHRGGPLQRRRPDQGAAGRVDDQGAPGRRQQGAQRQAHAAGGALPAGAAQGRASSRCWARSSTCSAWCAPRRRSSARSARCRRTPSRRATCSRSSTSRRSPSTTSASPTRCWPRWASRWRSSAP